MSTNEKAEETPAEVLEQFDLTELDIEEQLEGAKLEAAVMGNLAIAVGTVGVLTPVVGAFIGPTRVPQGPLLAVVGICAALAVMLYVLAVNSISVVYRWRKREKGASNG